MKRFIIIGLSTVAAAIAAGVSLAAPVSLPQLISPGNGSRWDVYDIGGTSNGDPTGGSCNATPGLTVWEAQLGGQGDAFDAGLTFWLNNDIFDSPDTVDLSGTTLTAGPVAMFGLNVTMQYFAAPGSATMRTFVSLQNPTASGVNATAAWVTNVGSDGETTVLQTSTLDLSFTTADRWIVTDDVSPGGDPAIVHVLYGPGSPQETPASVSQTVFGCGGGGTPGVLATFDINVPAGQTRHLMFFNNLADTANNAVVNAASLFNSNPGANTSTAELITGLSQHQLSQVLNWDFEEPTPTPTPTSTATVTPTAEPTRVRVNVGGAVGPVVAAAAQQAQENRERAAATAVQPAATVQPPRTGTGVSISPPNTGDAGLADRSASLPWALAAAAVGLGTGAYVTLVRRR